MEIGKLNNESGLTDCRKIVFAMITLAILILAIYSNTFHSPFHFDDSHNIEERSALHLKELSWSNIKNTFYKEKGNLYRPVACLSLAINYYFGEKNVFGYHLVNVSIHFISSCFLFLLIYRLINLPVFQNKYSADAYFIALLSAILWATNPLQTQAVTYIVQRMASLAGMFYVISMYLYIKGRVSQEKYKKYFLFASCSIAGLLSFGSKENAAMLPLSLFLLDVFFLQGLSKKNITRAMLILSFIILAIFLLALLTKGITIFTPAYYSNAYEFRNFTLMERLLTQPRVLLFYISLLLYPMPYRLCLAHEIPISYSLLDPITTIFSIIAIISIIISAFLIARKYPLVSFCVFFFFINHLIESTIFPLELVFEHRNYIPSMFFFLPIALLFRNGIAYFSYKRSLQAVIVGFVTLFLVAQGHGAFIRNMIWETEESLWIDVIEKYPHLSRGHHNLGNYYQRTDQNDKAIKEYKRALELPEDSHGKKHYIVHTNLGLIYASLGDDEKAVHHYREAIGQRIPGRFYPNPYNNLGVLMLRKGRYDEAAELFVTLLNNARPVPVFHHNMGLLYLQTGRFKKAIHEFNRALELDRKYLPSLQELGIAYKSMGQYGKAVQCFERVLIHNPKAVLVRMHLAETYLLAGEMNRGRDLIHKVLSDTPPRIVLSVFTPSSGTSPPKGIPSLDIVLEHIEKYYCIDVLSPLRQED
jgi:protein O-mannosyl-transferase